MIRGAPADGEDDARPVGGGEDGRWPPRVRFPRAATGGTELRPKRSVARPERRGGRTVRPLFTSDPTRATFDPSVLPLLVLTGYLYTHADAAPNSPTEPADA